MTGKIKLEEKNNTKKADSNFFRNFIFAIGLILFGLVILVSYKPQLFDFFFKGKSLPTEQVIATNTKPNKSSSEESYSVGPEPSLPSFAPEESEIEIEEGEKQVEEDSEPEAEHPYEKELDNEERDKKIIDSSEKQMQLMHALNDYRLFLANAERLVTKFKQDQIFYNELKFFNSIPHSNIVNNTLVLLKDYNHMLSNPECEATDKFVDIFSSKLLNKFIKVTKISQASEEQKQLKKGIEESLPILVNYIYSSELQENFIK